MGSALWDGGRVGGPFGLPALFSLMAQLGGFGGKVHQMVL